MGLLAGVGGLLLVLAVMTCVKSPAGLLATCLGLMPLTIMLLLGCVVALAVLVVLQDGCDQTESLIIREVSTAGRLAQALMRYYLAHEGGDNLREALKGAGTDVDAAIAKMTAAQDQLISSLQGQYALGPSLSGALVSVTSAVSGVQMSVSADVSVRNACRATTLKCLAGKSRHAPELVLSTQHGHDIGLGCDQLAKPAASLLHVYVCRSTKRWIWQSMSTSTPCTWRPRRRCAALRPPTSLRYGCALRAPALLPSWRCSSPSSSSVAWTSCRETTVSVPNHETEL